MMNGYISDMLYTIFLTHTNHSAEFSAERTDSMTGTIKINITECGYTHHGLKYKVFYRRKGANNIVTSLIGGQKEAESFMNLLKATDMYDLVDINGHTWETYTEE
jgi:hypothetical protein